MSPKPPIRGITTVSIHNPRPDYSLTRPGFPLSFDGASGLRIPTRPTTTIATAIDLVLNHIIPMPARAAVRTAAVAQSVAFVHDRPLKDYWITSLVVLPAADAEGMSTLNGRQYVQVPEGGTVQVSLDSASGFYRAKLPSELHASGPLLRFDTDSRLWQPIDTSAPSTYPLSTTRLEAFRTDLDFSTVEPDGDGLLRFNGKLYVQIESYAYQVLHDLDASTPHRAVMRIVRPEDPIAADATNVYVASRPGRSEAITFNAQSGWRGTSLTGVAGMPRGAAARPSDLWLHLEVTVALEGINKRIKQDQDKREQLINAWLEASNAQGEHAQTVRRETMALLDREVHCHKELKHLGKALKYYEEQKSSIKRFMKQDAYLNNIIRLQKKQMLAYQQLIECGLTRHALEGPMIDLDPERLPRTVNVLGRMLSHLKERQQIADNLVNKWRVSPDEFSADVLSPMDTHNVVASWVLTKSLMLDTPQSAGNAPLASELATRFGQVTFVYGALGAVPEVSHPAVLNNLFQECTAIRHWFERLDLAPGEQHATSRREITAEIEIFEQTLVGRLNQFLHQADRPVLTFDQQNIDFEFIPAQDRSGLQPPPKLIFRAKKNGVYKLNVGESRRTAQNEEVIEVRNLHNPRQPSQTYDRGRGEWRSPRTTPQRSLPSLVAEATRHLDRVDAHVRAALHEERQRNHPDNIVEMLESSAGAMDDTVLQLQRAELAHDETTALIRRLQDASERLRNEGETIRLRIYKDKHVLNVDRLLYLIDKGHVNARKIESRLKRGKGSDRQYLDIYLVTDAHTHDPLWHAHFHYARQDSPDLNFNVRGAHLKTLEQSSRGIQSQRREELAQRPHQPVWREYLDGRTAQKIFDLAAASAHPMTQPQAMTPNRPAASAEEATVQRLQGM
ncbi:hypothetical protein [Pseudomonas sp. S3_B08]